MTSRAINNNNTFKFCPFCPEPLDHDRQVLVHAIGDHTADYLKLRNEESLESIFQKLPAIKGTIIEKRILAKRRGLNDEDEDVLRRIEFVSTKSIDKYLDSCTLESKNDEPVAENAPLSCCSSGYHSGAENDQLSSKNDREDDHQTKKFHTDDQNAKIEKSLDNHQSVFVAAESTNLADESLPILKVENHVVDHADHQILDVKNDQNVDQSIIADVLNDDDQNRTILTDVKNQHQINYVIDQSVISIPENNDAKTTTTLNDADMDVLFGENGFFAINDEISTILTENIANREPLVDPILDVSQPPPAPSTSNGSFSVLKSILNAHSTYLPQTPSVFTQQMTPVFSAMAPPLDVFRPTSSTLSVVDQASRRRAPILPTPAPPIFPPHTSTFAPSPTTTPRRPLLLSSTAPPPPKRCRRNDAGGEYKRADLLFGGVGTSLTFVDVVVCRVCRIVAGPTEQVLRHEMSEHCLPRYLCPAAMCSLVSPPDQQQQQANALTPSRCYNSFPDLEYLRQHVRSSHPDFRWPFVCPFCRSSCPDFETYARHAVQEYEIRRRRFYRQLTKTDISIRCKQCKVVAITQLSWLRHRCRCYPNSPYAQTDAQLVQQIEASLNLAPPEREYSCPHNRTICEKYPACYFDEDGFLKLSNECPLAHPSCEAQNGVCRTPGCFDYHQNQGSKFCRFCEPHQVNIP